MVVCSNFQMLTGDVDQSLVLSFFISTNTGGACNT